ncbi:hypothetical protein [Streptomyces echinatus]|uniref:hypothetical protein n=1 Tax=Streptomyces echinatus TaxID=67293 RepID=UPI00382EB1D6
MHPTVPELRRVLADAQRESMGKTQASRGEAAFAVGAGRAARRSSRPALLCGRGARSRVRAARTVSAHTALQLLREPHGELDTGSRPSAAFVDASGMAVPTAAYSAGEARLPSAA